MDTSKRKCLTTSIEHNMGTKGSTTSVVLFGECVRYLIGKQNQGLKSLCTFMNGTRLGTLTRIQAGAGQSTGCGFDNQPAWTSDICVLRPTLPCGNCLSSTDTAGAIATATS